MLTLSIVRHAKSSWGDPGCFAILIARSMSRGKAQAQRLGIYLANEKHISRPDHLLIGQTGASNFQADEQGLAV